MNYYENMLKFATKKEAESFIKSRTSALVKPKTSSKKLTKDEFVDNIRRVLGLSMYMYAVDVNQNIFAAYPTEDGKYEVLSVLDELPGFDIQMLDTLVEAKDSYSTKLYEYSFILSYYFLIGNYQKFEKFLLELKKDEDVKYRDIDISAFGRYRYSYSSYTSDDLTIKERELIHGRAHIAILHAARKLGKDNTCKNTFINYIDLLEKLALSDTVDDLLSNKMIRIMHERIMHDYGELGGKSYTKQSKAKDAFENSRLSILDTFETRPDYLRDFLYMFPNDPEKDGWNKISHSDDYRIRGYVKELKSDKERLLSIFKNYLYSTYALGQKHSKLEDILRQMSSMLEIIGFDDVNILEIVEDLPDKIQRFALKAMIGE